MQRREGRSSIQATRCIHSKSLQRIGACVALLASAHCSSHSAASNSDTEASDAGIDASNASDAAGDVDAAPAKPEAPAVPPMGWNTWNAFGCNVSASLVQSMADTVVSSGMRDLGYTFVIIDDCWQVSRATDGTIQADPTTFPQGIKAVADYVHLKGLKLGIYTDAGTATCQGRPGSQGYEAQDAQTYASWGVDYVKEDWCNASADPQTQYKIMHDALVATKRPMVFSICDWGLGSPWVWGPQEGNLWRTTLDISDSWASMLSNLDTSSQYASAAGPGHWNDPDMLEVGNGGMTDIEYQSHFSMWAMLAAPLISGNDLRTMTPATAAMLTNADVIAVDQDPLGKEGTLASDDMQGHQIWTRPLASGETAVALFNRSASTSSMTVTFSTIGIQRAADARDLWMHASVATSASSYVASVPSHGVVMLKLTPQPQ
jgi:alpha-galactosidase